MAKKAEPAPHRHSWTVTATEEAPQGFQGRMVTLNCPECDDEPRTILTLKTDAEIQVEIDAYSASSDSE